MITGELRNKIDRIWETFWTGGITNPLDVIEQFTYLLFIKQLDEVETVKEKEDNFLGVPFETMFPDDCQNYRWSKFKNLGSADEMYDLVAKEVFPFIKNLHQLNINQIRFVNLIVDYIVVNGNIDDNKVLMEEPFRPVGSITTLFKDDMGTAKRIMDVVADIKRNSEEIA